MGYREEVAAWNQQARQQRAQREYAEKFQEVQNNYRSNLEMRNDASHRGDRADWDYWDSLVEQDERDLQAFMPVQQPQVDPRAINWDLRNRAFLDRHGPNATRALQLADGYATRPKIPHERDLARTGMGLQRNSPQYFKAVEAMLETHGERLLGVKYDPREKALTPDEAAKISNLSPRHYNHSVQTLQNQGRIGRDD